MMKSRISASRILAFALALSMLCAAHCASAQPAMPEGMKGWWFSTGANTPDQFAADPLTACIIPHRLLIGFVGLTLVSIFAFACATDRQDHSRIELSSKVAQLIDAATHPDLELRAFADLQALGENAIPFIISHLDDMRSLPIQQISVENHPPDAFEARAQYGAEVVHDALAAILRQMTGLDIGAFDADRPPIERQALREKNRVSWSTWCRSRYPSRHADCGRA